jgi:hypothetical protein
MKELSIEDKAKRYDEAIERAKGAHNSAKLDKENGVTDKITEYTIQLTETIFPELKEPKESEDEKVRREIRNFIWEYPDKLPERTRWLAWFEKQGEQKPADKVKQPYKVKPKFKVGDWICTDMCIAHITLIKNGMYYFDEGNSLAIVFVDKYYHLWTIEDAKPGDVLYYECHGTKNLIIVKSVGETKDHVEVHFWYDITCNVYEVWDGNLPYSNIASLYDAIPATKEQRNILFKKMKEAGYEWDAEKKESKKIEDEI